MQPRRQEMGEVARALGVSRVAGKAALAAQEYIETGQLPRANTHEYFRFLRELFSSAERASVNIHSRCLSLTSESAKEYSDFLRVVDAWTATPEPTRGDDFEQIVRRLRDTANSFLHGERPSKTDAEFLASVLRLISSSESRRASDSLALPAPRVSEVPADHRI